MVKMSVVEGGRDRGTGKVLSGYGVTKQKSKLALTRSDFCGLSTSRRLSALRILKCGCAINRYGLALIITVYL